MGEVATSRTERGFAIARFKDRAGLACSAQESSLAEEPCLWLGLDRADLNVEGWHPSWPARMRPLEPGDLKEGLKLHAFAQMHLTREMARDMIPLLVAFVETGELPEEAPHA